MFFVKLTDPLKWYCNSYDIHNGSVLDNFAVRVHKLSKGIDPDIKIMIEGTRWRSWLRHCATSPESRGLDS
jgi:hypothetical protein